MALKSIFLAILQGLTEFLPISSSGHLLLAEKFIAFPQDLAFDVLLHLGSALALILFFLRDWSKIFAEAKSNFKNSLLAKIIIALIPAGILGFALEKWGNFGWRQVPLVVFNLIFFGLILLLADFFAKEKKARSLSFKEAFLIGLAQAIALFPGVSRSGITISAGLFLGLSRKESARFSFLLATPAILGANLIELPKLAGLSSAKLGIYLLGFAVSFVMSYLVIKWFLRYLRQHRLWPFVLWRIAIALAVLILWL
ncbi:undecaprenyl-diphosphate phosphatase [bacterium]|nr:undecaprenyl-diphosphate phosphatase [bacterium]